MSQSGLRSHLHLKNICIYQIPDKSAPVESIKFTIFIKKKTSANQEIFVMVHISKLELEFLMKPEKIYKFSTNYTASLLLRFHSSLMS